MNKSVKEQRLLLLLPLLVIPFLTMAFWALGGGRGKAESNVSAKGLNLKLPDAKFKEEKLRDKLDFYDKASRDSLKLDEWMKNDPYFKRDTGLNAFYDDELQELANATATKYKQGLKFSPYEVTEDNPEEKVLRKLKLLEKEISKKGKVVPDKSKDDDLSKEVERLEEMLKMKDTGSDEDPEIKQLEGTLDRILDIQHPQRVKERMKEKLKMDNDNVFAVSTEQGTGDLTKGFYGVSNASEVTEQNLIEVTVHGTQVIVTGSVVKFRLDRDIYINGQLIPKDNFISGIATLEGERMKVEISSITSRKNLYAVKLEVYDMDGLPGIYIPGTITRDVARQSADNSLSLMDMSSVDPSLKAQATRTGIGAIKSLFSRKLKLTKVTIKNGYKVFFKNKN
jgi:conjugative transposon TraM protein